MDSRLFDSLTRSFAIQKTRRGLLGSMAAMGAGLLGSRSAHAQVSQAQCGNQTCANNPGKCGPNCVCCLYTNARGKVTNSRCRPPGTCSPGAVSCPPGWIPTPNGGCADPCAGVADGVACGTGQVCLDGVCLGNGVCDLGGPCQNLNPGCGGDTCGYPPFGQNRNSCSQTVEGHPVCTGNYPATFDILCESSSECPANYACVSSCLVSRCEPLCGTPEGAAGPWSGLSSSAP